MVLVLLHRYLSRSRLLKANVAKGRVQLLGRVLREEISRVLLILRCGIPRLLILYRVLTWSLMWWMRVIWIGVVTSLFEEKDNDGKPSLWEFNSGGFY